MICDLPAMQATSSDWATASFLPLLVDSWLLLQPRTSDEAEVEPLWRALDFASRLPSRSGATLLNLLCESRV
ncbi:hypothetical protein AB0M44_48415 [Streptosporangium subroseum]|uniref:hypothetical protein n=1 Tax=Streptosporangium subroseum TaxID=106412 RepID=UPI0034468680